VSHQRLKRLGDFDRAFLSNIAEDDDLRIQKSRGVGRGVSDKVAVGVDELAGEFVRDRTGQPGHLTEQLGLHASVGLDGLPGPEEPDNPQRGQNDDDDDRQQRRRRAATEMMKAGHGSNSLARPPDKSQRSGRESSDMLTRR
jgi:hypothetical protein